MILSSSSVLGARDQNHTLAGKEPRHTAVLTEISAVLREEVADLRSGPIAIVGEQLQHHRDPAGAVAFEAHLLVRHSGELAGAAMDGPLDVVGGHVGRLGGGDRGAQPGVAVRVAARFARRDRDLTDDLGEELAALGVGPPLLVLDRAPLVVARHEASSRVRGGNWV